MLYAVVLDGKELFICMHLLVDRRRLVNGGQSLLYATLCN